MLMQPPGLAGRRCRVADMVGRRVAGARQRERDAQVQRRARRGSRRRPRWAAAAAWQSARSRSRTSALALSLQLEMSAPVRSAWPVITVLQTPTITPGQVVEDPDHLAVRRTGGLKTLTPPGRCLGAWAGCPGGGPSGWRTGMPFGRAPSSSASRGSLAPTMLFSSTPWAWPLRSVQSTRMRMSLRGGCDARDHRLRQREGGVGGVAAPPGRAGAAMSA